MTASLPTVGPALREIGADAFVSVWPLFQPVIASGDAHSYSAETHYGEACEAWTSPPNRCFVAERGDDVAGANRLKPNHCGLGDRAADAGHMNGSQYTRPRHRQRDVRAFARARCVGFTAMPFNSVVSTNTTAVRRWQRHGLRIVGLVSAAFRHAKHGPTDAYAMHREL